MDQETPQGQEGQTNEPQYTEIQLKAIDQGCIPKEEFDGDESEFIDAAEFVRRGELFKKIEAQSKHIKRVEQALEAFRLHHTKVKESEYQRALNELKNQRKQAMRENDGETAIALEEKIEAIEAEKHQVTQAVNVYLDTQDDTYTEEFQNWVSSNPWYESSKVMRKAADAIGIELYKAGHSPQEVLRMVEAEIKKEFPEKFQRKSRPTAVEAPTRSGAKSDSSFAMTPEEKEIMRKIVSVTPGYTEADYIKDLKRTR